MSAFGFDIKNSEDFFSKLREDCSDFKKDSLSSRIAINCAMTAWHLTEWVYHEYFAKGPDKKTFQSQIKSACPSLQIMNDIADGTKHWTLSRIHEVKKTDKHEGDIALSDFSFEDFNVSRLIVTKSDGRVLNFRDELKIVLDYWTLFFSRSPRTL